MIDHLTGDEFIQVTSYKGSVPYISSGAPMAGMVSYDSSSQNMKIFDGNGWQQIQGGVGHINLSPDATMALNWAQKKMREEAELARLCNAHLVIKSLVDDMNSQIANYQHKIEMVKVLIADENTDTVQSN